MCSWVTASSMEVYRMDTSSTASKREAREDGSKTAIASVYYCSWWVVVRVYTQVIKVKIA